MPSLPPWLRSSVKYFCARLRSGVTGRGTEIIGMILDTKLHTYTAKILAPGINSILSVSADALGGVGGSSGKYNHDKRHSNAIQPASGGKK